MKLEVEKVPKERRKIPKYWNFKNTGSESEEVDLRLDGEIAKDSWWGERVVNANDLALELEGYKDKEIINLCINSLGGSVTEATAIYNILKRFKATNDVKIITHIDGIAASAASFIAMVGDEINMGVGASLMIHNVQGGGYGESKDLRKRADLMDKLKNNIIDIYKTKTHLSNEEISNLMDEETWMNAVEALSYGFIDKIADYIEVTDEEIDNKIKDFTNNIKEIPERIRKFRNSRLAKPTKEVTTKNNNNRLENSEEEKNMPKTVEELRNSHPQLVEQIVNEARKGERERIKQLDNLINSNLGKKSVVAIVNKAKYEDIKNPGDVALEIMNSDAFKAEQEVENTMNEQGKDGINNLSSNNPETKKEKKELENKVLTEELTNALNNKRGL